MGIKDISTFQILWNLSQLYTDQGKLIEAGVLWRRALKEYEKVSDTGDKSTLDAVYSSGLSLQGAGQVSRGGGHVPTSVGRI